jgi:hypothetical protein
MYHKHQPYLICFFFQPAVHIWLPTLTLVIIVDHTTTGDGGWRSYGKIFYFKEQRHLEGEYFKVEITQAEDVDGSSP